MSTYLTPAQAAEILGLHPESIRRLCKQGRLAYIYTPGGHRRIDRRSVEQLAVKSTQVSPTVRKVEVA